jgi:hypothetical protein
MFCSRRQYTLVTNENGGKRQIICKLGGITQTTENISFFEMVADGMILKHGPIPHLPWRTPTDERLLREQEKY